MCEFHATVSWSAGEWENTVVLFFSVNPNFQGCQRPFASMPTELPDENLVLLKEVVPRTQHALYVLRIGFCALAAYKTDGRLAWRRGRR